MIRFIGDVDGDGKIDVDDAYKSVSIAAGFVVPSEFDKKCADANGDGGVGANDFQTIIRHLEATGIVDGFFDTDDIITNEVI